MANLTLPEPDSFGNYWFGSQLDPKTPVLFASRLYDRGDQALRWMVYLGAERGFVWDTDVVAGPTKRLLKLRDPRKALRCLNMLK